jgi:uncharacterized protein YutD
MKQFPPSIQVNMVLFTGGSAETLERNGQLERLTYNIAGSERDTIRWKPISHNNLLHTTFIKFCNYFCKIFITQQVSKQSKCFRNVKKKKF